MKFPNETIPMVQPCTHTIYRPFGGVEDYRQIHDPAGRLAVTAFPLSMARSLAATCELWSACYVIAGRDEAYIGESNRAVRCVAEHAAAASNIFGAEAYLLHAQEPHVLPWSARLRLAHRLNELAKEAGLVTLANTVEPRGLPCPGEHAAALERLVADGRRLLFDAGCRIFNANLVRQLPAEAEFDDNQAVNAVVETGLPMAPPAEGELEFDYCCIWARGHHDREGFVVRAGSEVRNIETPSLRQNIKKLRADLLAMGVVVPIAGIKDRLRFQVDWRFFSAAVAAKFVAGAHVASTKWVRPRTPGPIARAE
ncbi:hypothetical protein [Bradyrhizobium japonicum]|uniref:hypothetical protein n=1 Tax=Bradyrhizobium japonicum TaxID=375 RepID=UPI000405AE27|nr:hypothetical protein [Bradyrhizobium japonicum]